MKKYTYVLSLILICLVGNLNAQWTSDALDNTLIAANSGEQVLPKVAVHSDGSLYICWFTTETGSYNVRLQRLDRDGNPLWDANGILVSSEAQDTWITDYDMAIDPEGYAVITFMDVRTGNPNPVAYRISPGGEHMWGASGILLANNSNFDPSPKVCVTTAGNAVFAWQSVPSGNSTVRLQKISPDGQLLWGEGIVLSQAGVNFAAPFLFAADGDHVFLAWHKETGPFWVPNRGLYVQKLNIDGSLMWANDVVVFAPVASGPVYYLETCRDDQGGIIFTWYRNHAGLHFHSYIQRMTHDGQITMQAGGALLSTTESRNHFYPVPAFLSQTQEIITYFSEQDLNQNMRGLYAQKFDLAGNRLWTDEGKQLIPLGSSDYALFTADGFGDKAICVYQAAEFGNSLDSKIQAVMLNAEGNYVWPSQFVDMSTHQSAKLHNVMTGHFWGQWVAVWQDKRNDAGDIYAQNIQPNGTLGLVTTGIATEIKGKNEASDIYPNPFSHQITIVTEEQNAILHIYDSKGNLNLTSRIDQGANLLQTASLAPGLYFYKIVNEAGYFSTGKIIKQ